MSSVQHSFSEKVTGFYDQLNGEKNRHRLELIFVRLAIVGFLLHIGLILFNRLSPALGEKFSRGSESTFFRPLTLRSASFSSTKFYCSFSRCHSRSPVPFVNNMKFFFNCCSASV